MQQFSNVSFARGNLYTVYLEYLMTINSRVLIEKLFHDSKEKYYFQIISPIHIEIFSYAMDLKKKYVEKNLNNL